MKKLLRSELGNIQENERKAVGAQYAMHKTIAPGQVRVYKDAQPQLYLTNH